MRRLLVPILAITFAAFATEPPIVDAAHRGDAPSIQALIAQHTDVNAPAADGDTALHWAAHHDDIAAAELLIGAGANVNAANRYGVKPLSLACANGSARMIEL